MVDPVVTPLINVGVALTSMLLNAAQQSEAAAIASEARDPISFLAQSLLGRRGTQKDIERRISKDLTSRMQDMNERCSREGIDPDRLANPCAEVEDILRAIDDHKRFLEQAVHDPDAVRAFFEQQAQNSRIQVDERLVPYFDELLKAVTELYITYAERSSNYQQLALKHLLKSDREKRETLARLHDTVADVPHKVAEFVSSESKPSRVFFGSRPDAVVGERFIERGQQERLNSLIDDPTQRRTVLVGMRGCGKTQLAAALAHTCEEAQWSLVAWLNAGSRAQLDGEFVELARKLKIDLSDEPDQEQIVGRCIDHLRSADASDRLIVLDNVVDIEDLRDRIPRGAGLRVVATTTSREADWEENGWKGISVGVFSREESINYLLTVTGSQDRDTADAIAERLGDLPLAIAQAAATAHNEQWTLASYARRLEFSCGEKVISRIRGHYYSYAVSVALWMATDSTLERLDDPLSDAARRQLGALCLLAESGVPTRWLDPAAASALSGCHDAELDSAAERAHRALIALINASIIHQSADGSTTMLHRLQAQVLRESWNEQDNKEALESAANLLGSINIDKFRRTDTESRRREARSLIEQFHAIGDQKHSLNLRTNEQVTSALSQTLTHARDLGLVLESVTLEKFAKEIEHVLGTNDLRVLNVQEELAYMIMHAGRSSEAINMYERILDARTKMQGSDHSDTLTTQQKLAYAYYYQGDEYDKAIKLLEHVHSTRQQLRGDDDVDTLMAGSYLALVYHADGRLQEAMSLYEQVIADRTRLIGADHEHTLVTRNNLAYAYSLQGLGPKAIDQYEQVLSARTRKLGALDRQTLMTRSDLALAYALNGELAEAVGRYESVLKDCVNALGTQHPLTVDVCENLEAARRELAEQEETSHTEEREEQD